MVRGLLKCASIGWLVFMIAQIGQPLDAQASGPVRLEKGTKLTLELDTPVNSNTTREGDPVLFLARNDIKVHGVIAIRQGTPVRGTVAKVSPAFVNGKPRKAELQIQLDGFSLSDGSMLSLKAHELVLKAETAGHSMAGTVLQGSAGSALMGGLMGGLIGGTPLASRIGAVAAIGVSTIETSRQPRARGPDVDLPREAVFETKLERPLDIPNPALLVAVSNPASSHRLPLTASVRNSPDGSVAASTNVTSDTAAPALGAADSPSPVAGSSSDEQRPLPLSLPTGNSHTAIPVDTTSSFAMSLDVNRVLVDAVVRDRSGNPLANLKQEDFRLFEDGVEQEIRDFSRNELPLAVALVIDRSGSVAPLMNRIQNAAFQALQQLKPGDEVCLITFASDVDVLEKLTADRARVSNRIGAIHAGGGTAIVDAIDEAFRYLAQSAPGRRRAVILISDNVEGRSRATIGEAIQLASETDAVVYSVKIGPSSAMQLPSRTGPPVSGFPMPTLPAPTPVFDPVSILARETGGEVFATSANALDGALATAITRLKLRYPLSFAPANTSLRGYHTIKVSLADRFGKSGIEYTVHSRSGYFGGAVRATAEQR